MVLIGFDPYPHSVVSFFVPDSDASWNLGRPTGANISDTGGAIRRKTWRCISWWVDSVAMDWLRNFGNANPKTHAAWDLKSKHLKENNKNKQAKSYPPVPHATRWRDTKNRVFCRTYNIRKHRGKKNKRETQASHKRKQDRKCQRASPWSSHHSHHSTGGVETALLPCRAANAHVTIGDGLRGETLALQRWPFCGVFFSSKSWNLDGNVYMSSPNFGEKNFFGTYWIW